MNCSLKMTRAMETKIVGHGNPKGRLVLPQTDYNFPIETYFDWERNGFMTQSLFVAIPAPPASVFEDDKVPATIDHDIPAVGLVTPGCFHYHSRPTLMSGFGSFAIDGQMNSNLFVGFLTLSMGFSERCLMIYLWMVQAKSLLDVDDARSLIGCKIDWQTWV